MSLRYLSDEVSSMNCGFESSTERYLVNNLIADGINQFCNAKELFFPVMSASKFLEIDYKAVTIYGGGPFYTYGDMIQHLSTLDFVIRYKLGKIVNNRHEFKLKYLSAECIEQFICHYEYGPFEDRTDGQNSKISIMAKDIVDYVFEDHVLGECNSVFSYDF